MSADAGARDVLSFLTKKRKNKKEEKKKDQTGTTGLSAVCDCGIS